MIVIAALRADMIAINKSKELGIPREMVDRPIAVTLRRAWAKNSFWGKCKLLGVLISSAFETEEVSAEDIENLEKYRATLPK